MIVRMPYPLEFLPATARLEEYEAQAESLLRGHRQRDPELLSLIGNNHPRFLESEVRWLALPLSADEIAQAPFDLEDARLTLARLYSFRDWDALSTLAAAMEGRAPGV